MILGVSFEEVVGSGDGEEPMRGSRGVAENQRSTVFRELTSGLNDDDEARQLYLGYAREDRCAMWVRIPDEADASKALRALADFNWLHARYYGEKTQQDFHVSD